MIDALISDIQNPGKGTAGLLSHLRGAEFTPSNSPDSFAAYLERISGYSTQPRDMDSYQNRFDELSHRETAAAEKRAADIRAQESAASDAAAEEDAAAAARRDGEKTTKGAESESVDREPAGTDGNTEQSGAARAEKSAEDASTQDAETKPSVSDQEKTAEQRASQQGKNDKTVNGQAGEAEAAAAGERGLNEGGTRRRADRLVDEERSFRSSIVEKNGEGNERTEQSNAKLKHASEAVQKQAAADETELQAQQTAQELAAQQKVAQEQSGQGKAAAVKNRLGDADGSKELSLQRAGDENRETLTGRELRNRQSEGRLAGEGEGRPRLTVIDRRSASARSGNHSGNRNGAGFQNQSGNSDFSNALNGQNLNAGSKSESDGLQVMQVHLRADGTPAGSNAQAAGRSGDSGIRGQLLQQLQDHLNNDIVKRSSILIRENGSGEIKLDLKPDNLGQVRIRITMENNHIAGKIFVENSSVKEAFDQNMQQLYRAFKEHGFEDAALNVSVGDQGREQQERGRSHGPQPRVASQQIHSLNEQSASVHEGSGELRLVDVMA